MSTTPFNHPLMTKTDPSETEAPLSRQDLSSSGFLIFSFAMMIILSIAALLPLFPNDFFPYVRIGEEIINTGHIPSTEFMTYTQYGNPAIYLYWLPSVFFYGVYKLGGVTLTSIISILCLGSFYTFLWLCLRELKTGWLTSGLILLLVALMGVSFFPTRPQLLAYPLFSLTLLIILRWQKGENRHLWVLPLIALLWANFHASFIILFFILLPALIFGPGNRRQLMLFTIISLLATLINYYGPGLWTNMFAMLNNPSIKLFSVEWKPPVNNGWQSNLFFGTLLLIPVLAAYARPKIRWVYWIWFLGLGWMALTSVRYIVWFLPVEAIMLSLLIQPLSEKKDKNSKRFQNRTLNVLIGVCLLIFPLALLPGIRSQWWQQSPPVYSDRTPVKAAQWLKQNPQLPDNLWCDFTYGTYLTYELPQRKLFATNRFEDLSMAQLEDYQHIAGAKYNWQTLLDKYNIQVVMPDTEQQPDLILALSASPDWREIYRDEQTILFLRNHP